MTQKEPNEEEKEQLIALATYAKTISAGLLVLGIFIPFFQGKLEIRQFVLAFSIAVMWLALSVDWVALAHGKTRDLRIILMPFLLVAWFSYWLLK